MLKGYIEFKMTPIFDVTTALIISFILGIGISATKSDSLKQGFNDFGEIIEKLLSSLIIPLLPFYILGVFMNITASGEVFKILENLRIGIRSNNRIYTYNYCYSIHCCRFNEQEKSIQMLVKNFTSLHDSYRYSIISSYYSCYAEKY